MDQKIKGKRRNDLILAGGVLLAALLFWLGSLAFHKKGERVTISVDGAIVKEMSLDEDGSYTVELEEGGYNTIRIQGGRVSMEEADCPDKLCVHHRAIRYNNETIICLPHRVVVEISSEEEAEADVIAR